MRKSRSAGFTLVEVLVALGIAGGTLVLVLSSNNASLRQSLSAREEVRLERAAESKFEECVLGLEPASRGELTGLEGWSWEAVRAPTHVADLKHLKRVTFYVYRPDGSRALERTALVHAWERAR